MTVTDDEQYSTTWAVEEYEPPPMVYIVELERTHVSALLNAARMAAVVPGVTQAEVDLMHDVIDNLQKQTVNL